MLISHLRYPNVDLKTVERLIKNIWDSFKIYIVFEILETLKSNLSDWTAITLSKIYVLSVFVDLKQNVFVINGC